MRSRGPVEGMGPAGTASATPWPRSTLDRRAYASGGLREGPPNPSPRHPSIILLSTFLPSDLRIREMFQDFFVDVL